MMGCDLCKDPFGCERMLMGDCAKKLCAACINRYREFLSAHPIHLEYFVVKVEKDSAIARGDSRSAVIWLQKEINLWNELYDIVSGWCAEEKNDNDNKTG